VSLDPDDKTVSESREPFLDRWSRRKAEARQDPPPAAREQDADAKAPPPELLPVEKLTIDSDYRAFFHPKVGEDTRRAALKKLFGDPHFNIMDGLDVYIDDYSKTEPIPPAMLAGLRQAQKILEWAKGEDSEKKDTGTAQQAAPPGPVALAEQDAPAIPAPASTGPAADENLPAATEPAHGGRKRS
jgi:hypothetical protein